MSIRELRHNKIVTTEATNSRAVRAVEMSGYQVDDDAPRTHLQITRNSRQFPHIVDRYAASVALDRDQLLALRDQIAAALAFLAAPAPDAGKGGEE